MTTARAPSGQGSRDGGCALANHVDFPSPPQGSKPNPNQQRPKGTNVWPEAGDAPATRGLHGATIDGATYPQGQRDKADDCPGATIGSTGGAHPAARTGGGV